MSAQGPQYHGTGKKWGEEGRFRENTAGQTPLPMRHHGFSKPLPGGRSLEFRKTRRAVTPSHPFKVTSFKDGSTWKFRVETGFYNGVIPTIDEEPLNNEPEGELGSGTRFVYIKATHDLLTTDGYVYSAPLDSSVNSGRPEIVVSATEIAEPTGPNDTGIFYVLLATFDDGAKTGQLISTSLFMEVADNGAGDGTAFLTE